MEADWEVAIGGDAPVIEAAWAGLVDLRGNPERVLEITEAAAFPALADALVLLNQQLSPVWTAKCDLWMELDAAELDPFELDAEPEDLAHGAGGYIDLLSANPAQPLNDAFCRKLTKKLQALALQSARMDLILRRAYLGQIPESRDELDELTAESFTLGVTAYLTTCGPTAESAWNRLAELLGGFAEAVCSL